MVMRHTGVRALDLERIARAALKRIAFVQSRMPGMRAHTPDQPDVAPVGYSAWQRGVVVGLALYALAVLIAGVVAGLSIGSIIGTLVFVGLGAGTVLVGLGLSAEERAHRPSVGESDFVWRWIVHLLPLRVARAWTVLLGCVFLAGAWYVWSVNRPASNPEAGRYAATFSPNQPGFSLSFVVAGDKVRDAVLAWQASCTSGANIAMSGQSFDAYTSGWTSTSGYDVHMTHGGIAHVHTISDTGHFVGAHTATGLLSLAVTVKQNGQTADHCATGALHWIAHRQGTAGVRR